MYTLMWLLPLMFFTSVEWECCSWSEKRCLNYFLKCTKNQSKSNFKFSLPTILCFQFCPKKTFPVSHNRNESKIVKHHKTQLVLILLWQFTHYHVKNNKSHFIIRSLFNAHICMLFMCFQDDFILLFHHQFWITCCKIHTKAKGLSSFFISWFDGSLLPSDYPWPEYSTVSLPGQA